jgi:hypothetical protein
MIKLDFIYGEKEDVERILYTISKWDFYEQYYDVSWIQLPKKLNKLKIKEYSKDEIIDFVKEEYLNNSTKIYKKVEQEILSNWQKISEKIEKISIETNLNFPSELEIQLTRYGMGGTYWLPKKIILLATKFYPITTIVHELIHLAIEDWIQKYTVGQAQKERIVDLFMSYYFGDLFPDRQIPKWSQLVYQKIAYQEIDEIFKKYEPDMETVIKKVSEIESIIYS